MRQLTGTIPGNLSETYEATYRKHLEERVGDSDPTFALFMCQAGDADPAQVLGEQDHHNHRPATKRNPKHWEQHLFIL